ncbi:MAG: ABC transporter substrate-binding protein [Poseidonibacter sp.]|uniref:Tgt2/MlaC family protein n=1 Tax=Poseidonibacter sp. TaxID=2321188 RepID=UPI00359DC78A
MKLKNLLKIILIVSILTTSAFAIKKDEIKSEMNNKIDQIISILKNEEFDKEKKNKKIIEIIDVVFNYKLMARISLGKTWNTLSSEKQDEFATLFEQKLKTSYIEKLNLYTDQKVKIIDLVPYLKSRLQLTTEVIGSKEVYEIKYNFYEDKKTNEWLIYDIDLVGVSIIQTYRQQFSGLLKEKTFDEMLVVLKDTTNQND